VGIDAFNESAQSDSAYRNEPYWRFWQAAFASLKYVPKKWVSAQVLVREDVIDGKFSPLQGLVGVELKPTNWFYLKGNVARNFRAPTLNDLYWVPGGNADLKSEKGLSYESGLGFKVYGKRIGFELAGSYFHTQIDNWIIWLPDGNLWVPQNKRSVVSQGAETITKLSLTLGKLVVKLQGSYTYVSSVVEEGASATDASIGKQLIYVPQHQAKGAVSVHVARLFLQFGHQYTGLRYTTSNNRSSLPAFQISYLSFGYEHLFGKHAVGVNVTIDNLLNTEYQTLAWRPMPGRSFLINLNYKFL
jgi:iron complex outermembrane receptor protein